MATINVRLCTLQGFHSEMQVTDSLTVAEFRELAAAKVNLSTDDGKFSLLLVINGKVLENDSEPISRFVAPNTAAKPSNVIIMRRKAKAGSAASAPAAAAAAPAAAASASAAMADADAPAAAATSAPTAAASAPAPGTADSASAGAAAAPARHTIAEHILNTPSAMSAYATALHSASPQMMQLFDADREAFLNIMGDIIADGTALNAMAAAATGARPPQVPVRRLTAEQTAAVDRIVEFGFSREKAVEAYLVCDGNEELAVNYLLREQDD